MKNFIFKKNIQGSYTFTLESYDFSLPARTFTIPYNVDQLAIPEQYALGLFVTGELLEDYQKGIFTISDFEELAQKASEIGLFTDVEKVRLATKEEIIKAVNENDTKIIDLIIERNVPTEMENLIVAARENLNDPNSTLSTSLIHKIEDACGVELTIE